MINILKSDLYRAVRSKGFYIALVFVLIVSVFSAAIMQPGIIFSAGLQQSDIYECLDIPESELAKFSISETRDYLIHNDRYFLERDYFSQSMNIYYMFIIMTVIVIASDFSNGSVKNTLSSAISRRKYYISKVGLTVILCMLLMLLNAVSIHLCMRIFNNGANILSFAELMKIYVLQLPVVLALASVLSGLAFVFRKTAALNGVSIPLIFCFQLILEIFKVLLKFDEAYLDYELSSIYYYMAHDPSSSYIIKSCLICGALILVFNFIGYRSFRKAEIR